MADYPPPPPAGSPLSAAFAELQRRGAKGKLTRVGSPSKKMPFGVFLEEVSPDEVKCKVCGKALLEDHEVSQAERTHRVCAERADKTH